MEGFHGLVNAMVLKAVDKLSDDDAVPENTPVAKPNKGKKPVDGEVEPKKRPATSASASGVSPNKKPALAKEPPAEVTPSPEEPKGRKPALKRPAAAGPLIKKNFYKKDGRYGFCVDGKEKLYVTRQHRSWILDVFFL